VSKISENKRQVLLNYSNLYWVHFLSGQCSMTGSGLADTTYSTGSFVLRYIGLENW